MNTGSMFIFCFAYSLGKALSDDFNNYHHVTLTLAWMSPLLAWYQALYILDTKCNVTYSLCDCLMLLIYVYFLQERLSKLEDTTRTLKENITRIAGEQPSSGDSAGSEQGGDLNSEEFQTKVTEIVKTVVCLGFGRNNSPCSVLLVMGLSC